MLRGRYVAVFAAVFWAGAALAQVKPWELYVDPLSNSACDVVNADNAQLVVLKNSGQMVIITGTDVTLGDTLVDAQGFVFFEGDPAGTIGFAEDGDDLRSLWWVSLTGTVVRVNGFTGEPSLTDNTPDDYDDVPCDACEFWDDPSLCEDDEEPEDPPTVSVPICGRQVEVPIATAMIGIFGVRFMRRGRARLRT